MRWATAEMGERWCVHHQHRCVHRCVQSRTCTNDSDVRVGPHQQRRRGANGQRRLTTLSTSALAYWPGHADDGDDDDNGQRRQRRQWMTVDRVLAGLVVRPPPGACAWPLPRTPTHTDERRVHTATAMPPHNEGNTSTHDTDDA